MSDYCIRKTKCVTEKMSSILYLLSRGTCCPPVHVDVCPPSVCRARSRSQRKTPPCVWPAQTSLAALSDLMRKSHHSCGKKESFTRWCWHSSGANQSPTYAKKKKKKKVVFAIFSFAEVSVTTMRAECRLQWKLYLKVKVIQFGIQPKFPLTSKRRTCLHTSCY